MMCTGFLISKRIVITAGHCIYDHDRGGWARSVKVCPGRNGAHNPYGCQYVTNLWSVSGWTDSGKPKYDRGAMLLPDTTFWNKGIGYFGYSTNLPSKINMA